MITEPKKGPFLGMRHLLTFLIFLDIMVVYISRLSIGVAIVAMTNAYTTNPCFPEYEWNEKHKSYVISSFYWGYVITQFPGGYCCRLFGSKITLFVSTLGSAIFVLFTPVAVEWGGWEAFCALRALQGLFQGVMFPAIHAHLAKWAPSHERSRLGALAHTGIECGTVLAMATSGIIAESPMGWPGISYVSGGLCLAWCALWFAFAADNPTASRFISPAERDYIESSLKHADGFHDKKIAIPWKAICTSVPFLSLLAVRSSKAYGFSIMQTQIPSYINGVLNLQIKSNGLYSALPFLVMWAMSYVYVICADVIMARKLLSLTAMRKTLNTVSMWLPAVGLIAIGFLEQDQMTLVITLMALLVGIHSGTMIGSALNTLDLSANHAGVLMGVVNCVANFLPLVSPLIVGIIVTDEHDRSQWQIVFATAAVAFFIGNLGFLVWGTSLTQPWDAADYLTVKDVENEPEISRTVERQMSLPPVMGYVEEDKCDERGEEQTAAYHNSINSVWERRAIKTQSETSTIVKRSIYVRVHDTEIGYTSV